MSREVLIYRKSICNADSRSRHRKNSCTSNSRQLCRSECERLRGGDLLVEIVSSCQSRKIQGDVRAHSSGRAFALGNKSDHSMAHEQSFCWAPRTEVGRRNSKPRTEVGRHNSTPDELVGLYPPRVSIEGVSERLWPVIKWATELELSVRHRCALTHS